MKSSNYYCKNIINQEIIIPIMALKNSVKMERIGFTARFRAAKVVQVFIQALRDTNTTTPASRVNYKQPLTMLKHSHIQLYTSISGNKGGVFCDTRIKVISLSDCQQLTAVFNIGSYYKKGQYIFDVICTQLVLLLEIIFKQK